MRDPDGSLARLPALDGVRALAIALVVVGHFIGIPGLGVAGVTLFFVLSGFLITRLLLAELEATGRLQLARFYWRRACRIIPAYLVWVTITWVILGDATQPEDRRALAGLLTYTYNYATPGAFGFGSIIHHAWSLSVEEQFYLLWPLGLGLLTLRRVKASLGIVLGVLLVWRVIAAIVLHVRQPYLDWAFETNALALAAGCWLASYTMSGGRLWWTAFAKPRPITVCLGIAIAAMSLGLQPAAGSAAWAPPFAILTAILVLSVALERATVGLLAHPVARWIGAISYSLYLWHLWGLAIGERLPLPHSVQLAAASVVTLLLASASYYLLERPLLRWRDSRPLGPNRPAALELTGP